MSQRGTRWERERAAEVARMYHGDGTPRWSLLRSIRRAYQALGWPMHRTPGSRRLEARARALDAVADDPVAYRRLLWSDPLCRPEAPDVVNGRGARACDRDHGGSGMIVDRPADHNQALQRAYDTRRAAGGEFYQRPDARARDAQRDPIDMRHGVAVTPYHDLQEGR